MDRRPCEHYHPGYYDESAGPVGPDFGLLVGYYGCCTHRVVAAEAAAGYYYPGVDFGSKQRFKLNLWCLLANNRTHPISALVFLHLITSRVSSLALLLLLLIIVPLIISLISFLVGASGLIITVLSCLHSHVRCRRLARILRRSRARV